MANIISFVEHLASNSNSSKLTPEMMKKLAKKWEVDEMQAEMLADNDYSSLEELLGANSNIMGMLLPAEDEDESDSSEDEEEIRRAS